MDQSTKISLMYIKYLFSVSITTVGDCPPGYADREGDLPGWGTDIGSALDLSLEDCAERCNGEKTCLSFEHSPTQIKCNLNKIAEPSGGPYSDFIFCTKIGNFYCSFRYNNDFAIK